MRIVQKESDGSVDIIFSWKEIWTLIKYRKLKLSPLVSKDFCNVLMKIVVDLNSNFDQDTQRKTTPISYDKGKQ